jgi:hypothetical protein
VEKLRSAKTGQALEKTALCRGTRMNEFRSTNSHHDKSMAPHHAMKIRRRVLFMPTGNKAGTIAGIQLLLTGMRINRGF